MYIGAHISTLAECALNWIENGAYMPIAQLLMAFQLGGVAFTHGIVEGKSFMQGQIPTCVFFLSSVALQVSAGTLSLPQTLAAHGAMVTLGFFTGYAVVAMGSGGAAKAAALSPVKWRKKRGF